MEDSNKNLDGVIYIKNHHIPLYVSPSQSQQGVSGGVSAKKLPMELSERSIRSALDQVGNPHANNDKFILNCSRFAKFLFEKQSRDFDKKPYQPLDSRILKRKLGKNQNRKPNYYLYIIESLKEIGMVAVNDEFESTKNGTGNCKGYRINLRHPDCYEVITTEDLFPEKNKRIDDVNYLGQLKRLKMYEMRFIFIANFLPHDEKQRAFYIYYNWINDNHFVTVDIYGRIHSLLTILDKKLRCCFSIDDSKQIKEWDIHACMPFLYLQVVLEHYNFRKAKKLTLSELAAINREICTYVQWIHNGRFYIELYRAFKNLKGDPRSLAEVKVLKKSFFKNILFSDTPAKDKERKIHKVFADLFPFINKSLIKFKRKEGFKAVAQTLQSLESEVMNLIIERLKENDPSKFYLRFHDAVITDDFDVRVESVMNETMKELYGINGRVKSEDWGADFDFVARNLKLHYYSTYLNHKKNNYIGKQKASYIKQIVGRVAPEKRAEAIQYAINEWEQSKNNAKMQIELNHNFKKQKLNLPPHWTEIERIRFREFALMTLNVIFTEMERHYGDSWIIEKNKCDVINSIENE